MTRSIFRLLPLLAATLFATPAAGQNLANLARPDANMMIGVRVADFASTPLAQRCGRRPCLPNQRSHSF